MLVILFLCFAVTVSARNIPAEDTTAKPAITAIGKPDGEKTEMKIGKEGGSFTSSDGKIRLIIPGGAFSKKTTFSIQPTTNLAPNGNGKAYRLEPSGIKFQKPLQLVFYYDGEESKGDMQLLTGITMQNDNGEWYYLKKFTIDTVAKTISGNINHFSSYSTFEALEIKPASAKVKVNKSIPLEVYMTGPTPDVEELAALDDGTLAPLVKPKYMSIKNWTVNNIVNGNSSVGVTQATSSLDVTYKAPASVPAKNPVAVVASLKDLDYAINGQKFKDLKLVSNITIYDDAYEVTMVAAMIGGSKEAWGGIVTYRDEGSFVVSLDKNPPTLIDIKNQLEVVTDNCEKIILNPTTCTGILHVAGARGIKITPANPPGQPYPVVEIWFEKYPTELTRYRFTWPPPPGYESSSQGTIGFTANGPNGAFATPMLTMFGMPALPTYIKFVAKEGEQTILEKRSEGGEIYYKFSVRKLKE